MAGVFPAELAHGFTDLIVDHPNADGIIVTVIAGLFDGPIRPVPFPIAGLLALNEKALGRNGTIFAQQGAGLSFEFGQRDVHCRSSHS